MKQRTVIILWIIAIVLGIAAYFVKFHGNEESIAQTKLSPGDKILPSLPIRELSSVTLHQGEDTTTLVRGQDDLWTIKERADYPANHELLRNLLGALHEVKVTQGFACASTQYGRFGLATSSQDPSDLGLRVTMADAKGNPLAETYLGKFSGATRDSAGRFVRVSGDDSGIYAVGETFPGIYADAPTWLDKQFLAIQNIQSISLSAPSDPDFISWEIKRDSVEANAQFELVGMTDKEIMQLTSTSALRNLFSYTTFQDVLTQEEAEATANPDSKLKRQATVQTFGGLAYTVTFWPQKEKPQPAPDPDSPLPPVQAAYLLTVDLKANLPAHRTKAADETPEDAQKKDAAFKARQDQLKATVKLVNSFKGRIYQVGHTMLAPLQKSRKDFVSVKPPTVASPPVRVPGQ